MVASNYEQKLLLQKLVLQKLLLQKNVIAETCITETVIVETVIAENGLCHGHYVQKLLLQNHSLSNGLYRLLRILGLKS